jgi:glycosyltransferase involved in cell wall biosynthesis
MRYSLFDIEVTEPLSDLPLSPEDAGIAVLLRRNGVPFEFWMQETNGDRTLSPDDVERRIREVPGEKAAADTLVKKTPLPFPPIALPLLTIAICTKDRPEGVERLLESLTRQQCDQRSGIAGMEILVIDNAPSNERTRELSARHPAVRYVREPRPGLNFARNRAVREANGELLAFLDDDVTVDQHWSVGLANAWTENPDAVAFTGQVLPLELETEAQILFEKRGGFRHGFERIRFGPTLPGNALYPGIGIFGTGANMAFKTEVIRRMGGFDEALDTGSAVPGGGDLDIFYRIVRAGHILVYEPRFLVFHQHRREMRELRRQYRRSWGLGFMCYLSKCLKSDPERRRNLRRLIVDWFADRMIGLPRQVKRKLWGQPHIPPSILLGELWGGVIGLLGGYSRSQRRVAAIRKRFP